MVALRTNIIAYDDFYATEDPPVAFGRVREMLRADNVEFADKDPGALSTRRKITGDGPEKHANVLYVVVESLSAEYLGIFGNKDGLSPNLDKLAGECLFFRNLRATGTRIDRGIEAVALSLPPTPGQSVIKRDENAHLFSIGPLFRGRGYETKFIYGGYAMFDRMDSFFAGNGFEVIDRNNFAKDEITFSTVWGHCDEDLFRRVLTECDKTVATGKPFCTVALTTSNHRPFMFPNKIDIPSGKGRSGGVKYTDYAIGDFLARIREKPWFDDTVIAIVADHCGSSAGRTAVQADRYHIPLFIYAPKLVKPAVVERLCSQMDITPTLLGLLGWTYESEFFGIDLLKPGPGPERAFVGNYDKVGLLMGGKLTLLTVGRNSLTFQVRADGWQTQCHTDPELLKDTIGYYEAASYLLKNHLYSDATQTAVQSAK
jgi:phosphoglycerol transferase MdoB-like AlkP superfamily enzyme